nr:Ltp family lipoprotein [Sporosarcina sp. BI001-red]
MILQLAALIVGLIRPKILLRWMPEYKRSRKFAALYFGLALVAFFILFGVTAPPESDVAGTSEQDEKSKQEDTAQQAVKKQEEKARAEAEKKAQEEIARAEAEKKAKESLETPSQQQAVKMALNYIDYTAFSPSGLIDQLVFEGFEQADATYAVKVIRIDWQEQAVLMAQNYLDYTAFSRSGLIEQLVFEGFSNDVATYVVNQVGL